MTSLIAYLFLLLSYLVPSSTLSFLICLIIQKVLCNILYNINLICNSYIPGTTCHTPGSNLDVSLCFTCHARSEQILLLNYKIQTPMSYSSMYFSAPDIFIFPLLLKFSLFYPVLYHVRLIQIIVGTNRCVCMCVWVFQLKEKIIFIFEFLSLYIYLLETNVMKNILQSYGYF